MSAAGRKIADAIQKEVYLMKPPIINHEGKNNPISILMVKRNETSTNWIRHGHIFTDFAVLFSFVQLHCECASQQCLTIKIF